MRERNSREERGSRAFMNRARKEGKTALQSGEWGKGVSLGVPEREKKENHEGKRKKRR